MAHIVYTAPFGPTLTLLGAQGRMGSLPQAAGAAWGAGNSFTGRVAAPSGSLLSFVSIPLFPFWGFEAKP